MFNRITYLLGVSCIGIIVSCCGNPSQNKSTKSDNSDSPSDAPKPIEKVIPRPEYHVENNVVTVSFADSTVSSVVRYSYLPEQDNEISVRGNVSLDFDEIIRSDMDNVFDIAYLLLVNNGSLTVSLESNKYSFSFPYTYQIVDKAIDHYASCDSPYLLPLCKKGEVKYSETQIKKWLYINKLQLAPSDISKMEKIADGLNTSSDSVLVGQPDKRLSVLKDLKGQQFRVKSNVKADYYYLFAANNYKEIDDFIADIVSVDYKNSARTLNAPLSCYRGKNSRGLLCVFLIGLNKDWSKNLLPLGLVYLDQKAPSIINNGRRKKSGEQDLIERMMRSGRTNNNSNINIDIDRIVSDMNDSNTLLSFSEMGLTIESPSCSSLGTGSLTISNGDFVGNTVNFNLDFWGDVHKMVVELGQTKQELMLSGKTSPYTYNCWLPLNIGDNNILITAYDKFGNSSSTIYYIQMVRINNEPNIYIDNEVNVYTD